MENLSYVSQYYQNPCQTTHDAINLDSFPVADDPESRSNIAAQQHLSYRVDPCAS